MAGNEFSWESTVYGEHNGKEQSTSLTKSQDGVDSILFTVKMKIQMVIQIFLSASA